MIRNKRKYIIAGILSLFLTFMQIRGWQTAMKYGTSVHVSAFAQRIGILKSWQCLVVGVLEFTVWFVCIYFFFSFCEKKKALAEDIKLPRHTWILVFCILYGIYIIYLIGCYPGFYNYDMGNQLPQIMYAEVPFNTLHPLLHTIVGGGIITLGYHLYSADLTFGVFLYCLFQMAVCAVSFTYSLHFIYERTRRKVMVGIAFLFYAICPPIIMYAMSTTKDIMCYAALLVAVLKLYNIYQEIENKEVVKKEDWIVTGILLVLSCLLRNNVVYGIVVFALFSICYIRSCGKEQVLFFLLVILFYFVANKGLMLAVNAESGKVTEVLSVPLQQIARLYNEKGEEAFEEDERELLFKAIDPEMIGLYDPVISDKIKSAFYYNIDTILDNKKAYVSLWLRKGLQYPGVYIASILDNTYQAWYPGTLNRERDMYRYFIIGSWYNEYGSPKIPELLHFYASFREENGYHKIPVIRLFFSIGAMLWTCLITFFYGIWKKDNVMTKMLFLVLLICATFMCGPVSDVRYYLILFYLFPVCIAFFAEG